MTAIRQGAWLFHRARDNADLPGRNQTRASCSRRVRYRWTAARKATNTGTRLPPHRAYRLLTTSESSHFLICAPPNTARFPNSIRLPFGIFQPDLVPLKGIFQGGEALVKCSRANQSGGVLQRQIGIGTAPGLRNAPILSDRFSPLPPA